MSQKLIDLISSLHYNKSDLAEEKRAVKRQAAAEWAAKHQIAYVETSATLGTNVQEAFELIINEVYRVLKKNHEIEQSHNTSNPTGVYKSKSTPYSKTDVLGISQSSSQQPSAIMKQSQGVSLTRSLHSDSHQISGTMIDNRKKSCCNK